MEDTRHWAALAILTRGEERSRRSAWRWSGSPGSCPAEPPRRWIVSSDPQEQLERIRPYVEMGFRHLVFHAPGPDQARFLNLYADQVLPRLRAAFG